MTTPDLAVAGDLYRLRFFPTLNGQPVDVTSVDRVELFTTAARTGVPVLTVQGRLSGSRSAPTPSPRP